MEDKLKNLDKVMEKAIYQKKRFSDEGKQNVMKRIREQRKPSLLDKYARMMKPVLSISVCIFLLIFAVSYILQPPPKEQSDGDLNIHIQTTEEVTSLPLLNRISHIAKKDNTIFNSISISKREKYVLLTIRVVPESKQSKIQSSVENMFYKGSELYKENKMSDLKKIGAPWNDYTVDINVIENIDHKEIYDPTENQPSLLRGVKPIDQDHITWIE